MARKIQKTRLRSSKALSGMLRAKHTLPAGSLGPLEKARAFGMTPRGIGMTARDLPFRMFQAGRIRFGSENTDSLQHSTHPLKIAKGGAPSIVVVSESCGLYLLFRRMVRRGLTEQLFPRAGYPLHARSLSPPEKRLRSG
jgi:hypothetical protein